MNFEHCDLLSWFFESEGRAETQRPCARLRDAERTFAISVRRSCHGLCVSNGVHPSDGTGILPVTPSRRIAAGHAAVRLMEYQLHMRKRARDARVNCTQRRMLCFSSKAL